MKNSENVTSANLESLNSVHLATLLEYLNTRPATSKKADRVEALRKAIIANPAKAQTAYDVIVLGKAPSADAKQKAELDALRNHFYGVMAKLLSSEQAEQLRASVEHHVGRAVNSVQGSLTELAKKALMDAAENYRPLAVKVGDEPTRKVKGVLPAEYARIMQLCAARVPTLLVGPAGCGKTYVAGKVAEGLGLDFYDQSCSEGVSESIFTGWLLPVGKGGNFTYVTSPFVKCYEEGGVFLLDEMDAADANLLTFLNKAIANPFFYLPQRFENPKVVKHRDFVVIGAANTYGHGANSEYVGRNALDAATLDRFRAGTVTMNYSEEVETALVHHNVLVWGRGLRSQIEKHRLRRIVSTRLLLDLTTMANVHGWEVQDWERSYFADWTREELGKVRS